VDDTINGKPLTNETTVIVDITTTTTLVRAAEHAPVADFTLVRVILSISAREKSVVHILGVSNAFVRAPLAEVVYVRPPKILACRFGSEIMKLNKALYGLKQAPLSWHLCLGKMFDTVKIIKALTPCLYAYNVCTIVVYVDDLIISGPSVEEVTELKTRHPTRFAKEETSLAHIVRVEALS
jgi:hypothetical protein